MVTKLGLQSIKSFLSYHFRKELASLDSEKVTPHHRSTGRADVEKKDFLEVNLVADHESQTKPAGDASGEEDVVIPDSSQWVGAVGEGTQRTNQECVEDSGSL